MNSNQNGTWGGVLIMGGRGRRMGGVDKSALRLNGQNFRDIALNRLSHAFQNIAVSTGHENNPDIQYPQFTDMDIQGESIGPAGGLLAAINWAEQMDLDGLVTLPVDTPILPETIYEKLCASGHPSYAQQDIQNHWLHAAWPRSVFSIIKTQILENQIYSMRGLHRAIGSTPVLFENPQKGDFKNINTRQDLEGLKASI